MVFYTNSAQETIEAGEKISSILRSGDVLLLNGDLGAGKTHFVKGIAKGLGINEIITSPTFTIENKYTGINFNLNHFDVYRVNDEEEILDLGFEETIYSDDISVIEWSDLIVGILPENFIDVRINTDPTSELKRKITISFSDGFKSREEELKCLF